MSYKEVGKPATMGEGDNLKKAKILSNTIYKQKNKGKLLLSELSFENSIPQHDQSGVYFPSHVLLRPSELQLAPYCALTTTKKYDRIKTILSKNTINRMLFAIK